MYETLWCDGGKCRVIWLAIHADLVCSDAKLIQQGGAQNVGVRNAAAPRREPGLRIVGMLPEIAPRRARQGARRLLIAMLIIEPVALGSCRNEP